MAVAMHVGARPLVVVEKRNKSRPRPSPETYQFRLTFEIGCMSTTATVFKVILAMLPLTVFTIDRDSLSLDIPASLADART